MQVALLLPLQICSARVDCHLIGGDSLPNRIYPDGTTILQAKNGKEVAVIRFYTRHKDIPDTENYSANCLKFNIVDSVRITIDTQQIFVPHTAFLDIVNIGCAGLKACGNRKYRLLLIGNDAGCAYYAEFLFDSVGIRQKAEWNAEMGWPDDTAEITQYHYWNYSDTGGSFHKYKE